MIQVRTDKCAGVVLKGRPTSPCCLPLLPACPLLAGALFLASPPGPRCSPSLFRTLLQKELSPFFVMDPRRKQGLLAWTLTQLGCFTLLMVGEKPQSCAKLQSPSPPLLKAWPRHILCVRLVRITRPHQCSHSSPQCPPPGPLDATSLDALYLPTLCTPTMPPAASPVPSPTRSVRKPLAVCTEATRGSQATMGSGRGLARGHESHLGQPLFLRGSRPDVGR